MRFGILSVLAVSTALLLAGCQTVDGVQQQADALTAPTSSVSKRQLDSRRFETRDEGLVLSACAGVLQDLGFTIDESSVATGLVVASKDRDAMEAGEVAGQVIIAALITALGGTADPVYDHNQKIRISVVTKPVNDEATVVRVTFQRVVWDNKGRISRTETIAEPTIYQEFFNKLSQSVFLEAHQV